MKLNELVLCTEMSCNEVFKDRDFPDFRCPKCGSSGIRIVTFLIGRKEDSVCQKHSIVQDAEHNLQ